MNGIEAKFAMTEDDDHSLTRPQRRLLRRIYNGRTTPIVADGQSFQTYKDASRYLRALDPQAREAAYAAMKDGANAKA